MESRALEDPLPGLAVVQRRGTARQPHRIPEYVGTHQRVRHDQPPVRVFVNPGMHRRTALGSVVPSASAIGASPVAPTAGSSMRYARSLMRSLIRNQARAYTQTMAALPQPSGVMNSP